MAFFDGRKESVRFLSIITVILAAAFAALPARAELVTSERFGYTVDFPEGFQMDDGSEDETMFLFSHTMVPVQAIIRVYAQKECRTAADALALAFSRLNARYESADVEWRAQECAVATFLMAPAVMDSVQSGWAVAIPLAKAESVLVMLAFSPVDDAHDLEQLLMSLLDSIMVDAASFKEPGIITAFAFPPEGAVDVPLSIAGRSFTTRLDAADGEAARFVIDREFEVFKLYALTGSPLAIDAWQRFYRMIARDSYGRLRQPAQDIYRALYGDAVKKDAADPEAALSQLLLTWAQGFEYSRASATADKADFVDLPSVLMGAGSDCDSRSLLLAILLKQVGIDTCMFVSSAYGHAMLGVCLPGKLGQAIGIDGKEYLVGETTGTGLTLGMMDASMQDRSKWIPVEFPF